MAASRPSHCARPGDNAPGSPTAGRSGCPLPDRRIWLLFGVVLLASAIWRLWGLARNEVWRDEAVMLLHTRAGWRELFLRLPFVEDSPPLGFLILKTWLLVYDSECMARMLSVIAGVAGVGVLMALARRFADRGWWVTGLLAAFSYQTLFFSQEIRIYAALFLVTALCFWAADRVAARPAGRTMLPLALLAALAAHLHVVGLLIFPMVMTSLAVRAGRRTLQSVVATWPVAIWAVLVLPILWFSRDWTAFHRAQDLWVVHPLQPDHVLEVIKTTIGLRTLRWWAAGEAVRLSPWAGFAMERVVLAGVILLPVLGLLDSRTRRIAAGLMAGSLVYLALLIISSLMTIPSFLDRTALPAWCPWLLAMGLGAASRAHRLVRIAAPALGILTALVWAATWVWLATAGPPRQPHNVAAFDWMRARLGPHDLIFSPSHQVEDLVVYRLGESIAAEQLLSPHTRVYAGRPPRHLLRRRERDPDHVDRLRAAIDQRRAAGHEYRIWVVYKGLLPEPALPGSALALIEQTHDPVGRFTNTELRAVHITLYAPAPATFPSP